MGVVEGWKKRHTAKQVSQASKSESVFVIFKAVSKIRTKLEL